MKMDEGNQATLPETAISYNGAETITFRQTKVPGSAYEKRTMTTVQVHPVSLYVHKETKKFLRKKATEEKEIPFSLVQSMRLKVKIGIYYIIEGVLSALLGIVVSPVWFLALILFLWAGYDKELQITLLDGDIYKIPFTAGLFFSGNTKNAERILAAYDNYASGTPISMQKSSVSGQGIPIPTTVVGEETAKTRCPYCYAVITAASKFCPACGKAIPQKTYCKCCGSELPNGTKFCPQCGAAVSHQNDKVICPQCGANLTQDAKFCPECGAEVQ